MALTKERRGEIAERLLEYRLRREGLHFSPGEFDREVGNVAKAIWIPAAEVKEFLRTLYTKIAEEMFSSNRNPQTVEPMDPRLNHRNGLDGG